LVAYNDFQEPPVVKDRIKLEVTTASNVEWDSNPYLDPLEQVIMNEHGIRTENPGHYVIKRVLNPMDYFVG